MIRYLATSFVFVFILTVLLGAVVLAQSESSMDSSVTAEIGSNVAIFKKDSKELFFKNNFQTGFASKVVKVEEYVEGDYILSGDFNGDSYDTHALYKPNISTFVLYEESSTGFEKTTVIFGDKAISSQGGLLPVIGDWDGNGTDTVGLYNPGRGIFQLRNSNTTGNADITLWYGTKLTSVDVAKTPVAGDWDGDGTDTVGLYDRATSLVYLTNQNSTSMSALFFQYGPRGGDWGVFVGDWNADGTDTLGVYDGQKAMMHLANANNTRVADIIFVFGMAGEKNRYVALGGKWK